MSELSLSEWIMFVAGFSLFVLVTSFTTGLDHGSIKLPIVEVSNAR